MTTDEVFIADPDDAFALAAIGYLAHNDFTDIRQVGSTLIRAKDGTREVFVWIDSTQHGVKFVPTVLIRAAARAHARIDIIRVAAAADRLKHMMNVVEAS